MPKVNKRGEKRAVKEEKMTVNPRNDIQFSVQFVPGRYLTFARFNDQDFIHVREYAMTEEHTIPTKKGVCFTPGRLRALLNVIEEIDEQMKQQNAKAEYKVPQTAYKSHLGAGIYASVDGKFHGVDLRRYWMPEGTRDIVPTKNGIYLPSTQWIALKQKLNELLLLHPELTLAEQCFHQNQMGQFGCSECDPFNSFKEQFGF